MSSTRKFSPSPTPILTSVVCKNGSIVGAHEVWRGGTFQSVEHREQESSLSCLDSTPLTIALPTVVRAGDRVLRRTQAIRDLPVSSSEGDEVQEWRVKGVHRTSMTMVGHEFLPSRTFVLMDCAETQAVAAQWRSLRR